MLIYALNKLYPSDPYSNHRNGELTYSASYDGSRLYGKFIKLISTRQCQLPIEVKPSRRERCLRVPAFRQESKKYYLCLSQIRNY